MFQADERVYSSLITAKRSSTATLVSDSESGGDSFRGLRAGAWDKETFSLLELDIEGRPGECCEGTVLVGVQAVVAELSVRVCEFELAKTDP